MLEILIIVIAFILVLSFISDLFHKFSNKRREKEFKKVFSGLDKSSREAMKIHFNNLEDSEQKYLILKWIDELD